MTRRLAGVAATLLGLVLAALPSAGRDGHWEPPGLHRTAATRGAILARYRAATGTPDPAYAQRTERSTLVAGTVTLTSEMVVRDGDFRVTTVIDGATFASGRAGGRRWRQTSDGVLRFVESDVQGDDLDRWPLSVLPWSPADCTVAGETTGPHPEWVLEYRTRHDFPHWFFIDEASGAIEQEVMREGARVVTWTFADRRTAGGVVRPFRWHVDGAGGPLDVSVDDVALTPVAPSAVSAPPARSDVMVAAPDPAVLPTRFDRREIRVQVSLGGRPATMVLDTGTSQIIVNTDRLRALGLTPVLGHAVVPSIDAGAVHLDRVPVTAVPLGRLDGILGYDFFLGSVVHIDYAHERVELLHRDTFVPPAGARRLEVRFDEGIPLVSARIGRAQAERVALDTGSAHIVLLRNLTERESNTRADLGIGEAAGAGRTERFLEGFIVVRRAVVSSLILGNTNITDGVADIEVPGGGDEAEFPIDAIIGTDVLQQFQWWIDAAGGAIWFR